MEEKFLMYNPITGENIYKDTEEELIKELTKCSFELLKIHTHGVFYKKVFVDEHGYEYLNKDGDNGTELPQEYINQIINDIQQDIENEIVSITLD